MPHKRAKKSVRDSTRKSSGYNQAPSGADGMDDAPKSAMRVLNSMAVQAQFGKRKRGELAPSEDDGRKKKPVLAEGEGGKKKAGKTDATLANNGLKIQDGESLAHFNRRVEDSLRSTVGAASRKAAAHSAEHLRKEREERMAKHEAHTSGKGKGKGKEGEEGMDAEKDDEAAAEATKAAKKEEHRQRAEAALQKKREAVALDFAPKRSSSAPKRLNDIVQAPPQLTLPRLSTKLLAKQMDGDSSAGKNSAYGKLGLSPAQARILEEERERVIKHYREMKARREYKPAGGDDGGD